MGSRLFPDTGSIRRAFEEEIAIAGGTVPDVYDEGPHLFLRGVLPPAEQVKRSDAVKGGVALRTCGPDVLIHPYLFRVVCRNGAIFAQAVQSRRVMRIESEFATESHEVVLAEVLDAVRACTDPQILVAATEDMRSMAERNVQADHVINLLPHLIRTRGRRTAALFASILGEFERAADRSMFGVMNAVTAVAREIRDPDQRWRLEEAGGGILAKLPFAPSPSDARAELVPA